MIWKCAVTTQQTHSHYSKGLNTSHCPRSMNEVVTGRSKQTKMWKSIVFLLAPARTFLTSCFLHRNIHSRSAAKVTIATMREQGACLAAFVGVYISMSAEHLRLFSPSLPGVSRALLHNFAGKPSVALEGVRAGYFFSFPPAVGRNQQVGCEQREHICWW